MTSPNDFLQYKRTRKTSSEPLEDQKTFFLTSLLRVILEKLKWEEDAEPDDMDEDDKAAFEELRKVRKAKSLEHNLFLTAMPPLPRTSEHS